MKESNERLANVSVNVSVGEEGVLVLGVCGAERA